MCGKKYYDILQISFLNMKIDEIIIHHTGGLGTNSQASTQHLTVKDIDAAHKLRWSDFKSKLGYYVGYTFVIERDGKLTQTRLIGEETAHTIGHNTRSIGIVLCGNFNKGVDTPTIEQKMRLKSLIRSLVGFNHAENLAYQNNTEMKLSLQAIYPHRKFSQTDCCGSSLSDRWVQDMLGVEDESFVLSLKVKVLQLMVQLLQLQKRNQLAGYTHDCAEKG